MFHPASRDNAPIAKVFHTCLQTLGTLFDIQHPSGTCPSPDSAQEKPQLGTVVAVGPGRLLDSGNRGELSVAIGDKVYFGKYGGVDQELNGREVKILRESDILAKVVD